MKRNGDAKYSRQNQMVVNGEILSCAPSNYRYIFEEPLPMGRKHGD